MAKGRATTTTTAAAANAALRNALDKNPEELLSLMRGLPPDVDPALGAEAVRWIAKHWTLGKRVDTLPPPVIRAFLETPRGSLGTGERDWGAHGAVVGETALVFLQTAVPTSLDDGALAARWVQALTALGDVNTSYAFGSKQRRAKITGLARGPFLEAIQAVAVGCETVPIDFLAALVADGSEGSMDALLPRFHRAATTRDTTLDLLERLRRHAADTKPVRAMFAEIEALLGAREAQSPALALAAELGIGDVDSLWFTAYLSSVERRGPNSGGLVQGHIVVDSRRPSWFDVSLTRGEIGEWESTRFDEREVSEDELGLGRCEARDLPAWLARAAEALKVRWAWDGMPIRTGLRGKKKGALVAWLSGGRA